MGGPYTHALTHTHAKKLHWLCQVSGISFTYTSDEKPGQRIIRDTVMIGGEPLLLTSMYTVIMPAYIGYKGKVRHLLPTDKSYCPSTVFSPCGDALGWPAGWLRHVQQGPQNQDSANDDGA